MRLWQLLLLLAFVVLDRVAHASAFTDIGWIWPDTVEIAVGGSADIYCSVNENILRTNNASVNDLKFFDEYMQEQVPDTAIEQVNATTIVFRLRNSTELQTSYVCKCLEHGIETAKVYVGYQPKIVHDFACRSYDFEYMLCNFTQPKNPVLTRYNLTFHMSSRDYSFDPRCNYEGEPHIVCNITTQTYQYRHLVQRYHFKLYAINALGNRTQNFVIDNFDVMVPAPPGDSLKTLQLSTNTLVISWRMPKVDWYQQKGLQWEILLQPDNFPERNLSAEVTVVQHSRSEMLLRLNNLPYAYYNYTLQVRVKVAHSAVAVWSLPLVHRFRTASRLPDRPPRTNVGSFYVNSEETQVRLYWEQLAVHEENGDNFTYAIELMNDRSIQYSPLKLEMNSAIYAWNKNAFYEFHIHSSNQIGESQEFSSIVIYPLTNRNAKRHTPRAIQNVYHGTNRTYTLTWEAPFATEGLRDYTVYWCHSKRALQNECKGSIYFAQVSSDVHIFTTTPQSPQQEHSLNLAVSANYDEYNTGMHWTPCTVDVNSDLVRMEPEVQPMSAYSFEVQWIAENVCPSILAGYNLTYCEIDSDSNNETNNELAHCVADSRHAIIVDKNANKHIIGKLKPFTFYKVEMYMFSRMKFGKVSESKFVRTMEAAPTPPRQLQVSHITQSSALISWLPPSNMNGKIRHYTIMLNSRMYKVAPEVGAEPLAKIELPLQNLTSYTPYKVFVTAHTVLSSNTSNDVHFTTFIGVPSMPGNAVPIRDSNNDTVIKWNKPTEPAGRIEFYEVAVTQMRNDEVIRRRISTVNGGATECALKIPACIDHEYKTTFEVRAVNAALMKYEVPSVEDREQDLPQVPDDFLSTLTDYDDLNEELLCVGGRTDRQSLESLHSYRNASYYRLYKSRWQHGPTYGCSANRLSKITTFALLAVVMSVCFMGALYMARKKYNKMANIQCKLPPGLDTYISKNSGAGFPSDFGVAEQHQAQPSQLQLQTQRSKDEYLYHNEKHHLLAAVGNDSGYLGDGGRMLGGSIKAASAEDIGHAEAVTEQSQQIGIPTTSYLRANSESSTDSLVEEESSSETEIPLTNYIDTQQLQCLVAAAAVTATTPPSQDYVNKNGYVTHANIASWAQAVPESVTNTDNSAYISVDCLAAMSDKLAPALSDVKTAAIDIGGGYVQPAEVQKLFATPTNANNVTAIAAPQTNLSGYTTLEELGKVYDPAGVYSNDEQETAATVATLNPTISGYVTQRDLTAFGQQQNFN